MDAKEMYEEIETLDDLVERVGIKMCYYHNFRQELAALKAVAEAAAAHLKHCDAGGARLEDALDKLERKNGKK